MLKLFIILHIPVTETHTFVSCLVIKHLIHDVPTAEVMFYE